MYSKSFYCQITYARCRGGEGRGRANHVDTLFVLVFFARRCCSSIRPQGWLGAAVQNNVLESWVGVEDGLQVGCLMWQVPAAGRRLLMRATLKALVAGERPRPAPGTGALAQR